jgi:hypothetical protein
LHLMAILVSIANMTTQHNAPTTSAPEPFPAFTFRTTAHVLGRTSKIKSNLATVLPFVAAREDGLKANLGRRWIWPGRVCSSEMLGWP